MLQGGTNFMRLSREDDAPRAARVRGSQPRTCALSFVFLRVRGPHSLARARARAALAGGWGGTGMATVPPGRSAAWAAAFWDTALS